MATASRSRMGMGSSEATCPKVRLPTGLICHFASAFLLEQALWGLLGIAVSLPGTAQNI